MDTWIKKFVDDSKEMGTDKLIKEGKASWTKGRQKDIVSVTLSFDNVLATLESSSSRDSEWYQFDRYVVEGGITKKIFRVLQVLITPREVGQEIKQTMFIYNNINILGLFIEPKFEKNSNWYSIKTSDVGKWLTIVIEKDSFKMLFAEKGKYAGEDIK